MRDSEHFTLWPTSPQNDDMSLFAEQRKQLVGSGFKSSSSRQQVEHDKERGNNIGILGSSDIPRDVATPKLCSNSWESQSLPIAREGTESAKRARKLAEEARLIGIDTAVELGKQTGWS